ncbi:hypothetical protein ACJA88_004817 [Fusarium oxysporum]
MSASEQSSEDNASDDGDFDMEESLPSQNEDAMEDRDSSTDSNRASKRKAPVEEDEYIKANPELYGLRRSTRPREQRKIVESDDSDSEPPVNRRTVKRRRVESSRPSSKIGTPTLRASTADSDSDSDTYGGARAKSLQKKARMQREAQPDLALAEKRWSSRRAAQWQGKSHLHDTWETFQDIRDYRGYRKVENYFRKVIEYEVDIRVGDDIPPETKEQFFLDRERDEEAFEDYTKVERVVASDRKETNLDTRSRMVKLEEQPDFIKGGELRNFQLRGLNFLCLNWTKGNNVILADEMGLGKTVQTVSFLSWLRNARRQEGPSLVVAPLSVIPAWCDTFNHWSPDINYVVYLGPEDARKIIREHELLVDGNPKKPKFNVLVTSYEFILQDWQFLQSIKWQTLAVDEAHRLKNRESQLYNRLVSFGIPCKILITGTPIQNNLAELSALLDFLNPGKVDIDEDLDSLSASDAQEKLQQLHKAIAPFILRRTKETVESDLPPKTEKIIRVELSDVQLEYYKNILTRNYTALCDATNGHKNSLLNIMMELKKISNHPYMFPGAEEKVLAGSVRREDQIKGLIASSGKMMLLDQLLSKLNKDGHRVLIFSQMVKMLDILVSKETVEEEVLERARNKLLLEYLTIQAGVTDDGKAAFKEELNKKGLRVEGPSSSEDIQMVLKMRSSKMFEQSGNQERLEQLDIDSILENAEVTKTKVDDKINLSSGGIDWDNFMQITDVKVDDINLDWDQIIPADKIAEIKAEEEKKQHEAYVAKVAAESAPRRAAIKSRHRESERDVRLKKRQKEQQDKEEDDRRPVPLDPKRPLNDKEQRSLIKAYFRYGSMDDRGDEIIKEAKLKERDPDYVKSVLDEFIKAAKEAVDDNYAQMVEEEKRLGKTLTKKDRKAVLIDFGDLKKVNAETAIERPKQLQLLRQVIRSHNDWHTFRLPDATKAASYSCAWGAKEDAMLLVGIDRHGFGAWPQIRDDPDLDMADKLFLEEHRVEKKEERSKGNDKMKAPGAVHLVRRSEYLLSVLQAKHSNDRVVQRAVENHHRNNKKSLANGHRGSATASPAPHNGKKSRDRDRDHLHGDLHRSRSHAEERGTPRPDFKRKHLSHEDSRSPKHRRIEEHRRSKRERAHDSHPQDERRAKALRRLDELRRIGDNKDKRAEDNDAMIWFLLKPVRENFERILSTTKDNVKSSKERASIFGVELVVIGTFLDEKLAATAADEGLKSNFWDFLAALWPVDDTSKSVTGKRLSNMYRTLHSRSKGSGSTKTNGA